MYATNGTALWFDSVALRANFGHDAPGRGPECSPLEDHPRHSDRPFSAKRQGYAAAPRLLGRLAAAFCRRPVILE